jgi:hypothetical protein
MLVIYHRADISIFLLECSLDFLKYLRIVVLHSFEAAHLVHKNECVHYLHEALLYASLTTVHTISNIREWNDTSRGQP